MSDNIEVRRWIIYDNLLDAIRHAKSMCDSGGLSKNELEPVQAALYTPPRACLNL